MNIKTFAIAALLAASAPTLAFAQAAAPATPSVDAGAAAGTAVDATASTIAPDFDTFLQTFGAADFTATTSAIDSAKSYNIVKISSLANADAAKLQAPLDQRSEDLASLRTSIGANAGAKAALEAEGLSSDNVVWVESGADGALTLYVNDI